MPMRMPQPAGLDVAGTSSAAQVAAERLAATLPRAT
jgi:hypothetical protein